MVIIKKYIIKDIHNIQKENFIIVKKRNAYCVAKGTYLVYRALELRSIFRLKWHLLTMEYTCYFFGFHKIAETNQKMGEKGLF